MINPKSVKKVLAGMKQHYLIERLVVIDSDRIVYSGDLGGFENAPQRNTVSYDYWKNVAESAVVKRFIHKNCEVYLFIGEVTAEV